MSIGTGLALMGGMALGGGMMTGGGSSSSTQQPAALDPSTVGQDSLAAQLQLMPQVVADDEQYAPQLTALNTSTLSQALTGSSTAGANGLIGIYGSLSPQLGQIQAASNSQADAANIANVQNLGLQATQAYQNANPLLTQQMSSLAGQVNAAGQNTVGPVSYSGVTAAQGGLSQAGLAQASGGPLLGQLTGNAGAALNSMTPLEQMEQGQAMQLLSTNGGLTAAQNAEAQDSARAAYSSRGLNNSDASMQAEVLNTADAQQNRLLQNQSLAQSVDSSTNAQVNANRSYALGTQSLGENLNIANAQMGNQVGMYNTGQSDMVGLANSQMSNQVGMYNAGMGYQDQVTNAQLALQQQQQNLNNQMSLAGMYQSQAQNPYALVLGQGAGVSQSMNATGQGSQYADSNVFDPWNSTIMSMYNTNYNAQSAAAIAAGNNSAATTGAGIGALGSLGSAALMASMMCWVAREVFGAESPRWRSFRAWMLTAAPAALRQLYLRRGERFARLIRTRPQLRAAVRAWMEDILARDEALAYGV